MPVIGTFSVAKDGYAGTIRTLTLNVKVQLVANDRREADGAPDFRIMAGAAEIGAAWRRPRRNSDETYLSVRLDDPALPQPIFGALIEDTANATARLIWRRDRKEDGSKPLGTGPDEPTSRSG